MFSFPQLLQGWRDWTGDKRLTEAIRTELRRRGYAVHASKTRSVHLAALERPGWVQVFSFRVETYARGEDPDTRRQVLLYGVSREDGRKSRIEVVLAEDEEVWRRQLDAWSEGLLRRPERR